MPDPTLTPDEALPEIEAGLHSEDGVFFTDVGEICSTDLARQLREARVVVDELASGLCSCGSWEGRKTSEPYIRRDIWCRLCDDDDGRLADAARRCLPEHRA